MLRCSSKRTCYRVRQEKTCVSFDSADQPGSYTVIFGGGGYEWGIGSFSGKLRIVEELPHLPTTPHNPLLRHQLF